MYEVRYVEDEALPPGTDWALVRLEGSAVTLFLKESKVCERVLEEASAGYRALEADGGPRPALRERIPTKALALQG